MKKLTIILILFICICVFVGCFLGGNTSNGSKADYLRIHIRANSNDEIDQDVKYKVKDALVEYLTPKIAFCKSKTETVELIINEKENLENLANEVLQNSGFDYSSNIKICSEMFPTRTYENYTLESGIYDAMIVELGSARGNNWWCVIYPPLCFTNFNQTNSTSVVYKSKILEIIKQFFS